MSLFALAGPAQVALPAIRIAGFVLTATFRQIFTVALLLATMRFFRPMVVGTVQALGMLFKPRVPLAVRRKIDRLRSIELLNRSAKEVESCQPNVAAELRFFAGRE